MAKKIQQIVKVHHFGSKQYALYDTYYKMYVQQTLPLYDTKGSAQKEATKRNKEYTEMGIKEGDTYLTAQLQL